MNSAVLTIEYMRSKNLKVNGVILNRFEMANKMHDDNKKMIEEMTGIKIIGIVVDGILKLDEKNIETLFE
ncbi:AAA family ATPase [Brachyspira hyodysenteriae]|nr:AAA family ATPase [Brachyspira hyodysenteriae]